MGDVILLEDLQVTAEERPVTIADLISVLSNLLDDDWRGAEWRWVCDYPDFAACDEHDSNGVREQYPRDHSLCGNALVWRVPNVGEGE